MDADDVVYSLKRWIDPELKSPAAAPARSRISRRPTSTRSATNRGAVQRSRFQLTQFFSSIIDKHTVEKLGRRLRRRGFNGTGPYCWDNWVPRQLMKRNPHYKWGPDFYQNCGPAHIERVVWKIIPENSTRLASVMTNQVQLTQYILQIAPRPVMKART
jgi:peptide/nickel transport system substrate-binding protein